MGITGSAKKHKRQILVIIGVLIFIAALIAAWYIFTGDVGGEPGPEEPEIDAVAVQVAEVQNGPVQTYVYLTGRLQPEDKIDIFSEVVGVMEGSGKPFKVGVNYNRGELLLQINNAEAMQNMISQRTEYISLLANTIADLKIDFPGIYEEWADYLSQLTPNEPLPELPEVQDRRQRLFLTGRNIYGAYHNVKQLEERLGKYRIYAPFSGTLTEVMINRGSLVMQGQKLGEFVKTGSYELRTSVSIDERNFINIGDTVKMEPVNTAEAEGSYTGMISRINDKVSPEMQTIEVYVLVRDERLTAGMYLEGRTLAREFESAVKIPREILVNGKRVFVVEDSIARLREVEILHRTADEVVVKGIPNGASLIMQEYTAAFENAKVSPEKQEEL